MKTAIVHAALLSSLFLACPAWAQDVAPAPADAASSARPQAAAPTAPASAPRADQVLEELKKSAIWQAYAACVAELTPVISNSDIKARIQQLDGFAFSAPTRQKLLDLFGNENPLHLKSTVLADGNAEVSFALDALDYRDPQGGAKAHFSALTGKTQYSKRYTRERTVASMPSIRFDDGQTTQVLASDLSYATNATKGNSGLWLGSAAALLGQLAIDDSAKELHLKITGLSTRSEVKQHGKLVDLGSDSVIKSIHWGKDSLGPVHMAFRVSNMDGKALAALTEKGNELNQSQLTEAERVARTTGMLKDFALATLKQGSAVDIQDISVQYHGMTAGLNGRVAFSHIEESDFATPSLWAEKLIARFNLHVPMALLTEISRTIARSTLQAQNKDGQPASERVVSATAKAMLEKMLEKPLQQKWIRIERDTLVSSIEFKTGKLSINGQAVALPAPK